MVFPPSFLEILFFYFFQSFLFFCSNLFLTGADLAEPRTTSLLIVCSYILSTLWGPLYTVVVPIYIDCTFFWPKIKHREICISVNNVDIEETITEKIYIGGTIFWPKIEYQEIHNSVSCLDIEETIIEKFISVVQFFGPKLSTKRFTIW